MTHPIYVCLEHELTFHTIPVGARHGVSKHTDGQRMDELMDNGIIIAIGTCAENLRSFPNQYCERNRLMRATLQELSLAKELKEAQIKNRKKKMFWDTGVLD